MEAEIPEPIGVLINKVPFIFPGESTIADVRELIVAHYGIKPVACRLFFESSGHEITKLDVPLKNVSPSPDTDVPEFVFVPKGYMVQRYNNGIRVVMPACAPLHQGLRYLLNVRPVSNMRLVSMGLRNVITYVDETNHDAVSIPAANSPTLNEIIIAARDGMIASDMYYLVDPSAIY